MAKDDIVVGFVGLGTMGGKMATNILKAGYKVVVHDLHRQSAGHHLQEGAEWADTPRALAEKSDVIFTSLPEPADVERVSLGADGLVEGVKKGAAYFDLSTNAQSVVKKIQRGLCRQGCADARCARERRAVRCRSRARWRSGSAATRPPIEQVQARARRDGRIAQPISGRSAPRRSPSSCTNMSGYAITCALAETFTMGVKAGMDPVALWEAVRQGVGGRRLTFDGLLDQFLPGKYDSGELSRSSSPPRTSSSRPISDANSAFPCGSAI